MVAVDAAAAVVITLITFITTEEKTTTMATAADAVQAKTQDNAEVIPTAASFHAGFGPPDYRQPGKPARERERESADKQTRHLHN